MAISNYLNSLLQNKSDLVDNLIKKGQTASNSETFSTLIPKVLDIQTGDPYNIFIQKTEPETKNGIWINSNEIRTDNINYNQLANLPYSYQDGSAVAIGTDIYLFGSYSSSYRQYAYKYNTLTNTYEQLNNIPYDFYQGSAVAIGTDIYLFGGYSSSYAYKYNTLTDTYTRLTNTPYELFYGGGVAIGTDIYLFDGSLNRVCKYNTLTDSYTRLSGIPYNFKQGSVVTIGTDIYLFGSSDSGYYRYAYKYDITTDSYTQLTNIPYNFYRSSAVAIGTDVYLFGSTDSNYYKYAYKYDTLTDTYTKLTNIPYEFYQGSAVAIGTDIYLFGVHSNVETYKATFVIPELINYEYSEIQILNNSTTPSHDNNSIIIKSDVTANQIKLTNKIGVYISGVELYKNNILQQYPIKVGNGASWNLL